MCNNTNYGAVICYSCDAIHHSQGAVAGVWGPWCCLLGWVGGGGLLPSTGLSHNRRVRGDHGPPPPGHPHAGFPSAHGVAI